MSANNCVIFFFLIKSAHSLCLQKKALIRVQFLDLRQSLCFQTEGQSEEEFNSDSILYALYTQHKKLTNKNILPKQLAKWWPNVVDCGRPSKETQLMLLDSCQETDSYPNIPLKYFTFIQNHCSTGSPWNIQHWILFFFVTNIPLISISY